MAVRTHYDVLQVARTASPDVVVAAYRSLSKRYHPDRNIGDHDAAARMAELNAAYAVLTDEDKRREHDRWIAAQERPARRPPPGPPVRDEKPAGFSSPPGTLRREAMWWLAGGVAAAAAVLAALTIQLDHPKLEPDPLPPPAAVPVTTASPPVEALPPLSPQPSRPAGYTDAASANDGGGRSRITLDNSGGGVAVEVTLLPLEPDGARRRVFLPAGGFFTMERVRGGRYRLAFHDMGDGTRSTGDAFQLGGGGKPGDLTFRLSQH